MIKKILGGIAILLISISLYANEINPDEAITGSIDGANSGKATASCTINWDFTAPGMNCTMHYDNFSNFNWSKIEGKMNFFLGLTLNELTFKFSNKAGERITLYVVNNTYDLQFDDLTLVFNDAEYSVKATGAYILNEERFEFPIQNEDPDADGETESEVLFHTLLF